MSYNNKKKIMFYRRYIFLLGCLVSSLGTFFYLIFRHKINFPINIFSSSIKNNSVKFFFLGININFQVNFFLNIFFNFINSEKKNKNYFKKVKYLLNKILVVFFSLIIGLFTFYNQIKHFNLSDILLFSIIVIVTNCCLIEILFKFMNQYGICNASNLILFAEFLPFNWIDSIVKNNKIHFFYLLVLTTFFIWLNNLKWEVPINSNNFYFNKNNRIINKDHFNLSLRLNFSFIPVIYLSQIISFINILYLIDKNPKELKLERIVENFRNAINEKNSKKYKEDFISIFFDLNKIRKLFLINNIKKILNLKKFLAFIFLINLRLLSIWFQVRYTNLKINDIDKDFKRRGTYIDSISQGENTIKLLEKIFNKMIIFWYFIILIFNFIFDNVFSELSVFSNWFSSVNIGVDILRQINIKYRFIKDSE